MIDRKDGVEGLAPLADPGARLAACLANQTITTVPFYGFIALGKLLLPQDGFLFGLLAGLVWSLGVMSAQLILLHRHAQTIGKRWFGVCLIRTDGTRPSLARLVLLRELIPSVLASIPVVGPLFFLADAACVLTPARRALHDLLSDTIAVEASGPPRE